LHLWISSRGLGRPQGRSSRCSGWVVWPAPSVVAWRKSLPL
jgi:hypothetical protein